MRKSQALRGPVGFHSICLRMARSMQSWTRSSAWSAFRVNARAYRRSAGMLASTSSRNCAKCGSRLHALDGGMPGAGDAVAAGVTSLGVLDEGVERPALIGEDLLVR